MMGVESRKTLRKKITPFFKKAALMATFCFVAGCDRPPPTPLTEGEADLVHSVFGDSVDTSIVQKRFYPDEISDRVADVNDRKIINFYGKFYQSPDFSHEKDIFNYGDFMHEITHIWQFQTPNIPQSHEHCTTYEYPLILKYRFSDYCDEQQAAIIEDYVRRFLHQPNGSSRRHNDTPESDALLQKVVEDQFPQARVTRLALEAQERTKIASARLPLMTP